ncbi:hypothetical protein QRQ56_35320 [Bradyrhizobium sp. U531]|uniref:alpha/beta hydrolase family protein n=1 Tax=Bradyrhizobium sp. U531 TaxID=3053458 RepID=UPI003F43FF67
MRIASLYRAEFTAYRLLAGAPDSPAPAPICISREDESGAILLARLLPSIVGRGISVLVITHNDVFTHPRGESEALLSYCFDNLSDRPDIDAGRIGVYGEGLSAALASQFAACETRVSAAVCDGGLWSWVRALASVGWMTKGAGDAVDELAPRRTHLIRLLKCPVLVLTGADNIIDVSDAQKLQSDCATAGIEIELAIPRMIKTPWGEIEDFVRSDNRVFRWLEHKLARNSGA